MKQVLILLSLILFFSCKQHSKTTTKKVLKTLQEMEVPVRGFSHLPRLKAVNDTLHMTWVEKEDSLALLKYSYYASKRWTTPEVVASGANWFVNWADFPNVAVHGGAVLATFLEKSDIGTYDYDIKYTLRDKKSGQWSTPEVLHNDGVPAEHGFVSLQAYEDGFFAVWLDGRNTKSSEGVHDTHSHSAGGAMTLRSAIIATDGTISSRTLLDNRVCDCCNTAITVIDNGIVVAYRNRSENENETRDMYCTIWTETGWSVPAPIHNDNWLINGCPVNGGALDSQGNAVVATWFTAAQETPRVLTAFSQDGGLNFKPPVRVDSGNAIGRVDTTLLPDGSALVLWMEPNGDEVLLQLKRVYENGNSDETLTITSISGERASGFPQLVVSGNQVFIAWTTTTITNSKIQIGAFQL